MRLALKIILLVVIILVSFISGALMFYVLFIAKEKFELSMLTVIGLSFLGFLSSWFHIKTIKLYKLDKRNELLPRPSKEFRVFNIAFAVGLFLFSSWVFYMSFIRYRNALSNDSAQEILLFTFLIVPALIASFIIYELYYLNRMLKKNRERKLILEIDDIKGNS